MWVAFLKLFPASLREEMKDLCVVLKKQAYKKKERDERVSRECVFCVAH